ncbi:MAG: glycosyltransferase family 2 protein [Candidatus Izemoplasmatales bacterium]|jgi:glycosyltransferase involved in cell wall biosynthesis
MAPKEKFLTFAVPAYNSEAYLSHCLDSLIPGGDEVEIIIINDGSTDGTEKIARQYEKKYPNIVKVISQANGGHGSGVNAGLENATGLYFKVVDSDDWLDTSSLHTLLSTIKEHLLEKKLPDLYITNFVYDKVNEGKFFVRRFSRHFKSNCFLRWSQVGKFYAAQVIMMHSLTYKTEKLRKSGLKLPHHTFYVDNIYSYAPLPEMQNLYYLDINLYHYFIGRVDQSVNIRVFTNRYDQQIRVMKEMINAHSYAQIMKMEKGLRRYMLHCLSAIMMITIFFTVAKDGKERRQALSKLWKYVKDRDRDLYRFLRWRGMPVIVNWLPWRLRGIIMTAGYKILTRRIKLG